MKKWISRLTKIAFVLFAFIAVMITMLINMGGQNDILKTSIQDYITQSTGYYARIDNFKNMTFYPYISVDIEGLALKKINHEALQEWAKAQQNKQPEARDPRPAIDFTNPDATIDHLIVSMGFWDVVFGNSKKIHNIYADNARFKPYTLLQKPLTISRLQIDETPEGAAFFSSNGSIGEHPFNAKVTLKSYGKGKKRKYSLDEESELDTQLGPLTVRTVIRPRNMGGFHLRDLIIEHNNQNVLEATLSLSGKNTKQLETKGNIAATEFGSKTEIDWKWDFETKTINGSMRADPLNPRDFDDISRFSKTWQFWNSIFNPNMSDPMASNITVETPNGLGTMTIKNNSFTFNGAQ